MRPPDKLYAYADTTKAGVGDHTWVTTYTPGTGDPDISKGEYWYCYGESRNRARQIVQGDGGVEFARTIASPHDPDECVGLEYGKTGVCHQMANRLLRFSRDHSGKPVTVSTAVGYQLSVAAYGVYGGRGFRREAAECRKQWDKWVSDYASGMAKE